MSRVNTRSFFVGVGLFVFCLGLVFDLGVTPSHAHHDLLQAQCSGITHASSLMVLLGGSILSAMY